MSNEITVIFGGPSPEHEISILTGLQCERVLTDAGRSVTSIYWTRTGEFFRAPVGLEAKDFIEGRPSGARPVTLTAGVDGGFEERGRFSNKKIPVDVVLNACHGGPGEMGVLNSILELAQIPCTGGPSYAAQLGMDKLAFGALANALGVPSVNRVALTAELDALPFEGPFIVKPRFGGSSIGIERVGDLQTAKALLATSPHLRAGAVIEPYLDAAVDINFAYRTAPELSLSQPERPVRAEGEILDFEQKYLQGAAGLASAAREFPAQISDEDHATAATTIRRLVSAGGFRGIGRVDFLLTKQGLLLNEINTIPGAMALYLWPDEDYHALLSGLLDAALDVPVASAAATSETIEALRVAGGISQKLRPRQ